MGRLPFESIRILDSTYVFALPYAAGLLADMGAEVIKIEGLGHIDTTRGGAWSGACPDNDPGEDWWNRAASYNLINRGKRSLTLDLSQPKGRELLKELIKVSDVLMENFTPRVMRRWELDYPNLRKLRPDIIMVSNTGYGHGDGPYSGYPAQATTQEATHGLCQITGYVGGPPSKAGQSFVDFLAAWSAMFAVAAALRHRARTGEGQWIDIGMYQLGCMVVGDTIMDYESNGRVAGRMGNRHPNRAPQGCYRAHGDVEWVVLSVGTDSQWRALCNLMGKPALAQTAQFADALGRQQHHDAIDEAINTWTCQFDKYDLLHKLQAAGIPAGPVFTSRDTHLDPHNKARGFLDRVEFPPERKSGTRDVIGRPYRFSGVDLKPRGPAPTLGQDNEALLMGVLGMDPEAVRLLEQEGIIGRKPKEARGPTKQTEEDQVRLNRLAAWDMDYKQKLGI